MLGTKLFAVGAVAIALMALLPIRLTDAAPDFYLHDTYYVVGPRYAMIGFALLCAVFAGFYYLGERVLGHPCSKGLSLGHFLLWIFALVAFWAQSLGFVRAVLSGHDPNPWLIPVESSAVALALLTGGLLFLINFAMAITNRVRRS